MVCAARTSNIKNQISRLSKASVLCLNKLYQHASSMATHKALPEDV